MRWLLRVVTGLQLVAVVWLLGAIMVCLNDLGASPSQNICCVMLVAFIAGFLLE